MSYEFFPKGIRDKMPPLYSQEQVKDPLVHVKFFTPWSNWTWYGTEFDGEDTFFGWVVGFEKELGYFSLSELQSARGPAGLKVERDIHFEPKPLSQVMADHGDMLPSVERKPRELPTFKGYTVDRRLRQFRKAELGKSLEFISFDSPEGQQLLREMEASGQVPKTEPYPECTADPPWMMTSHEYRQACVLPKGWKEAGWKKVMKQTRDGRTIPDKVILPDGEELYSLNPFAGTWSRSKYTDNHREKVQQALNQGLHVPAHVRAEYPGLKPSHSHRRLPQTEPACPACGGPGMSMGVLGRKEWLRCRNCGWEWSVDVGENLPQTRGKKEPLYPHVPKSREPLFPHRPKQKNP